MKASDKKLLKAMGRRIRSLREKQKISQNQLAYESGLSRQMINYIESGRNNTTVTTLASIAEALNVPLKGLVDLD